MTDPSPCRILGVLDDGAASLSATALAHLRRAQVVIGATRTLALLDDEIAPGATRLDLTGRLSRVPEWVRLARTEHQAVVVLATGDPLCHGIASYLAAQLCLQAIEVLPNVSTLQLACARLGLAWQDARIVSIHGADTGEWAVGTPPGHGLYPLAQALRAHDRLLLLTSPHNHPARVARLLLAEGLGDDFQLAVAARLQCADEQVWADLTPAQAAEIVFPDPNVVLLWRCRPAPQPVRLGLPDSAYLQRQPRGDGSGGLITKQAVRAVSLARLQLRANSRVWDIGAGSGSVGLEAARLCPQGHVWAVEKNEADVALARQNQRALGLSNHTLVHGKAPAPLADWPDPDAIFIGGSGGELAVLIALCLQRLRPGGWLVMNFVTLENLATATQVLAEQAAAADAAAADTSPGPRTLHWDVQQLQSARSQPILHMQRLAAENPVWIVCAQVGEGSLAAAPAAAPAAAVPQAEPALASLTEVPHAR